MSARPARLAHGFLPCTSATTVQLQQTHDRVITEQCLALLADVLGPSDCFHLISLTLITTLLLQGGHRSSQSWCLAQTTHQSGSPPCLRFPICRKAKQSWRAIVQPNGDSGPTGSSWLLYQQLLLVLPCLQRPANLQQQAFHADNAWHCSPANRPISLARSLGAANHV